MAEPEGGKQEYRQCINVSKYMAFADNKRFCWEN
jgi:hypothetical protein